MLLCMDIGNSTTGIGLYDATGEPVFFSSLETAPHSSRDRCAMDLLAVFGLYGADLRAVDGAIISCVVPAMEASALGAVAHLIGRKPLVVGPGIKTGLNIRSDLHNQLGSDIVACSVAALAKYPPAVIVMDLGTATTFSLLQNGVYEGCAILPGIRLSMEALSDHAAALPHIAIEPPPSVLGHNTVDAMRAGAIFGNAGMIDSMIARFEEAAGQPVATVVATGGNAPLILPHCTREILYDPHLLLDGLYLLYQKNTEKYRKWAD